MGDQVTPAMVRHEYQSCVLPLLLKSRDRLLICICDTLT